MKKDIRRMHAENRTRWKTILGVTIVISIVILGYVIYSYHGDKRGGFSPEKRIADFTLVSNAPLMEGGKIVVLFIGSEACPFCAAESWSIVTALRQYGSWSGLDHIISNSSESIPEVPGYGFANASYHSVQVSFWEVETTTSSWNHALQSPNSTEEALFQRFDPRGYIPFLLIGGMYLHVGSGVSPQLMAGMNWTVCSDEVSSPGEINAQVSGEASNMTAVINYLLPLIS